MAINVHLYLDFVFRATNKIER